MITLTFDKRLKEFKSCIQTLCNTYDFDLATCGCSMGVTDAYTGIEHAVDFDFTSSLGMEMDRQRRKEKEDAAVDRLYNELMGTT